MAPPAQQKWQFIVAWYDGSNLYIQVDDNPVDTLAYTGGIYDGNTMFLVGGDPYDGQRFDGAIDEVALYKRVLSDEERAWLYNGGAGRSYAELLGEQPASEGWMQRGYAYEGQQPHAVTSVSHSGGTDTYEYDQNGNMTCRQESGAWFVQAYNAENRIASIRELAEGDCETPLRIATQWDYAYDGDGARTATLTTPYDENGNPQTASLTTYYFGGAYEVTDGAVKKYYAFGGATVAMRDGNGLQYFLTDHLGSVLAVTDASGALISEQRYLPFGEVRTDVGEITQTDFGYTFQRGLPGTGLMDYRARFYAPYITHFSQPDSIIPDFNNPQALNRYSYGLNNPSRYTDPTGHSAECGIYAGTSCGGVGPQQPTLVQDQMGISVSQHFDIPQEDVINGVNNTWEFTTTVYSFIFEPVDWAVSGAYCVQGECSPLMLTGLLPFIPSSVGKHLDDVPWKSIVDSKYWDIVEGAFKGNPKVVELTDDLKVFRRYGGDSLPTGSPWFSLKPYVRPGNARRYLSLPNANLATNLAEFIIPKGNKILVGPAAGKVFDTLFGPHAFGGGMQVYLPNPSKAWWIK